MTCDQPTAAPTLVARRLRFRWGALAALGVASALLVVPLARADGDPASDALYGANLFPSYDSGMSAAALKALTATIDDAKKAGYEVRVAVIAQPDDLGAVAALWAKPRQYARFLGTELGIVYKGPLLVVMPNGFGFYHGNRDPRAAYAALAPIRIGQGDALAQATIAAVATLAAKAGHPFAAPGLAPAGSGSVSGTTLLLLVAGAVLAIAAAGAATLLYRRRRG